MATLNEVYQKFGEVSKAAQLLETELGTLLLFLQGAEHDLFTGDKRELATEIYNKLNKSTLGQILKQLGNADRGEVSKAAQFLETTADSVLLGLRGSEEALGAGAKRVFAAEMRNKTNKSTPGQAPKQLGESGFPGSLDVLLANALAERNRLFHSFYREHNFRRNSNDGRAKMIEDLQRMHETILEAYKAVLDLSGFDLDELSEMPSPTKHVEI
jgi:hypothetical protein